MPRVCAHRLVFALLFACVAVARGVAQTDSGAVVETDRVGRRVMRTLRSGPHPYLGDYPVTVYLPPEYEAGSGTYPVLYLFDGYDFHADHDTLCAEKLIQPAILVSIANKTADSRMYDLTPSESWGYAYSGGLGGFADLIKRELKPYLDGHFRTRPEAASTGVIGVSLGGLAACWLGYTQPETFGLAGVLEPSLWWNNDQLLNRLRFDRTPKSATRFWVMASDQEFPSMWQNAKYGAHGLRERGWTEGRDVAFCQVHNFPHGSAAAREQLRDMFHFLLRLAPPEVIHTELTNCHGPQLVPFRPTELGGVAYAYLDVRYRENIRTTAILPEMSVGDSAIVRLADPVLGMLVPVAPGWTTVTATADGFRAVEDVQGSTGSSAAPPTRAAPPAFAAHPASATLLPGSEVALVASATGSGTLSYQWRRDGRVLPGATNPTLRRSALTADDGGTYTVIATNEAGGSTLSRAARLVVDVPVAGRLANLSMRSLAGAAGQPLIVGFVVRGGTQRLLLRSVGPTLASAFGVDGALVDPRIEFHQRVDGVDATTAANNDWGAKPAERVALAAAFAAVGAFPLPETSQDAALLVEADAGCTTHTFAATGTSGIVVVEGYDLGLVTAARLVNVSARNHVATGAGILIGGFVIDGNVPKRVLIRGVGPGLEGFGVPGPLTNPRLELYEMKAGRSALFATNDDWGDEPGVADAARISGAFPLPEGSRDAALLLTLPAGAYTAQLSGVSGATGEGLVEVYTVEE